MRRYEAVDACWWADWQCAAIAHYSFLHRLRAGTLDAYDFNTWDLSYPEYQRWSINFFAFNSSDLSGPLISDEPDDEVNSLIAFTGKCESLLAYLRLHGAALCRTMKACIKRPYSVIFALSSHHARMQAQC